MTYPPANASYTDLESFKINTLSTTQYNEARQAGEIQDDELYLTPKDETVYAPLTGAGLIDATVTYTSNSKVDDAIATTSELNALSDEVEGVKGASVLDNNTDITDPNGTDLVTEGQVKDYVDGEIGSLGTAKDYNVLSQNNIYLKPSSNKIIVDSDLNESEELITGEQLKSYTNQKFADIGIQINSDNIIYLTSNTFGIATGSAFYSDVYDDTTANISDDLLTDNVKKDQLTTVKQLINYTTIDNIIVDDQGIQENEDTVNTVNITDNNSIITTNPLITKNGKTWTISLDAKYAQLISPNFTGSPKTPDLDENGNPIVITESNTNDDLSYIVSKNTLDNAINTILNNGVNNSNESVDSDYNSLYKIQNIITNNMLTLTNSLNTKVDKSTTKTYAAYIHTENNTESTLQIADETTAAGNNNKLAVFNSNGGLYLNTDSVTDNTSAATKLYVDNTVTNMGASKLDVSGGTITGDLYITSDLTVGDHIYLTSDCCYGTSLPPTGTEGQIFFQLYVEE